MELLKLVNNIFPKSNFVNGMIVELDTGQKRMYWDRRFIDESGFIPLGHYNDDLKNMDNLNCRENIDKIFTTKDIAYFGNFFDDRYLINIWSRY